MMNIVCVPSIRGCMFELKLKNTYLFTVIFGVGPVTIQIATSFCILIKVGSLRRRDRARILKATKTLAFTLGFYYLCWVPTFVETSLKTVGIFHESWYWLTFIAHNCIFLNSCFGFFIYYNTLPQFKKVFIEQVLGRRPNYVWPQRPTWDRNKWIDTYSDYFQYLLITVLPFHFQGYYFGEHVLFCWSVIRARLFYYSVSEWNHYCLVKSIVYMSSNKPIFT